MIDRRTCVGGAGAAAVALLLYGRTGGATPGLHFAVHHSPAEWQKILGPQRYSVLREAATERAFTSPLLTEHRRGVFTCAGCGLPLFASATKFESGTGWPSFWKPLDGAVRERDDGSLGMQRGDVACARCGGPLG